MRRVMISSSCLPLEKRIRDIDVELQTCQDETRRKSLEVERKIKGELLSDLLGAAYTVPSKNGNRGKK